MELYLRETTINTSQDQFFYNERLSTFEKTIRHLSQNLSQDIVHLLNETQHVPLTEDFVSISGLFLSR